MAGTGAGAGVGGEGPPSPGGVTVGTAAGGAGGATANATAVVGGEVEQQELDMPSLLDVIQQRFETKGGRESVTRLLYMGLIPRNSSQKEVCMYHKDFLKEIHADVTGLMILHGML